MKWKKRNKIYFLVCCFLAGTLTIFSQETEKSALSLNLSYFVRNNSSQYLVAIAQTKIEGRFHPVKDIEVSIFLDSIAQENLVGKAKTDETGKAKAFLPISLKELWNASSTHTFFISSEANKQFEEGSGELTITKSKIEIDTISDETTKTITVSVKKFENNEWLPVPDVDIKIGVMRSSRILGAGEDEFYTTDSTGIATAEFLRDSLPGDENGMIILAAKVEDNVEIGNVLIEKSVPWGVATITDDGFFKQRTLWSTRYHTPPWLLFMAYSIIMAVWGTLIYLIFQIFKIKKLGVQIK
jgi:hypothetical protein